MSLDRESQLLHFPDLLLGELAEEVYFLLVRWLPGVVGPKGAFQVGLDVHVEGLGLQL